MSGYVPIPDFTKPSYADYNLNAIQRTVNLYPEKTTTGYIQKTTPGLSLFTTVSGGVRCRGLYMTGSKRLFAVHGTTLNEIDSSGTVTNRGTLTGFGDDFALMADNGTQLLIQGSTKGWIFDFAGNTLTQITDVNYPATSPNVARGLAFKDGFFFSGLYSSISNSFYQSALNDGLTWTPAAFGIASVNSDTIGGLIACGPYLYVFSPNSVEVWYNAGTAGFTLLRVPGSTMDIGAYYPTSIATLHNKVYFVSEGQGKQSVWEIVGTQPRKVSTPFVEKKILGLNPVVGMTYAEDGHDWYVFSSYAANNQTWAYDITEGAWSERTSFKNSAFQEWRVNSIAPGFSGSGDILCGDSENGSIWKLTRTTSTENGINITRIRDFRIDPGISRSFHYGMRIELECAYDATGTTTLSATLQKSDDDGLTFDTGITLSQTVTSSAIGQQVVLKTPPLGMSKAGRVYRLTFTGPAAQLILKNADLNLRQGAF